MSNPVKDKLVIEAPNYNENTLLEVYSITGIKLTSYCIDSARIEIDFSKLEESVYIIKISRDNKSKAYRINKQ